mmetsp:Transcript_88616/g.229961  ORF Transcript_88616/g.229961 Transcript_88616/m.229961 type:complete len:206 (-) Transcript_88616:200-817(-)
MERHCLACARTANTRTTWQYPPQCLRSPLYMPRPEDGGAASIWSSEPKRCALPMSLSLARVLWRRRKQRRKRRVKDVDSSPRASACLLITYTMIAGLRRRRRPSRGSCEARGELHGDGEVTISGLVVVLGELEVPLHAAELEVGSGAPHGGHLRPLPGLGTIVAACGDPHPQRANALLGQPDLHLPAAVGCTEGRLPAARARDDR